MKVRLKIDGDKMKKYLAIERTTYATWISICRNNLLKSEEIGLQWNAINKPNILSHKPNSPPSSSLLVSAFH